MHENPMVAGLGRTLSPETAGKKLNQTHKMITLPQTSEKPQEAVLSDDLLAVGCPYARGTDIHKMHHLWLSREDAMSMDKEIEARRDPACGKPIHPGSCMCREHMRYSRGYNQRAQPYPSAGADFTCQHSPDSYDSEKRWICHDKNGGGAGVFETEDEAKAAVDSWNTKGGNLVTSEWVAPPKDADDSDRGHYIIRLAGTNFRIVTCCDASERVKLLRNAVAKYGFAAVNEILFAAQTQLTEYGWTANGAANDEVSHAGPKADGKH